MTIFKKYKSKPMVKMAILLTDENLLKVALQCDSMDSDSGIRNSVLYLDSTLFIKTLAGEMEAHAGDYLIVGLEGEFYPCKASIFNRSYRLQWGKATETLSAKTIKEMLEKHLLWLKWQDQLDLYENRGKSMGKADGECASFCHTDLTDMDFSNMDLRWLDFGRANVGGVCFDGSDLSNTSFRDANFNSSTTRKTTFYKAKLRDCGFANAILKGIDLSGADINSVIFE